MFSASLLALMVMPVASAEPEEAKVHVTVVSILATNRNEVIDPKLKDVAHEVQKKSSELTGFRIATTTGRTIALGSKEKFGAIDENEVTIEVNISKDNASRYTLQVKAPTLSSLTYTCAADKYFPIVTGYETKNGERLIIAVMVEVPKTK